jgi:type IV pilus assembly protein PilY1
MSKTCLAVFALLLSTQALALPVFGNSATNSVNENTTVAHSISVTSAFNINALTVNGGVDQGDFNAVLTNIVGLGTASVTADLEFSPDPDFENPTDNDTNNIYLVQLRASDLFPSNATQNITITVLAVNDNTPVITSGPTASTPENVSTLTTVYATSQTDADLPVNSFTYFLNPVGDFADFNIGATGLVTFAVSPNAEIPADTGGDNVYNIVVRVNDGVNNATQGVAITVTDVDEFDPSASDDTYNSLVSEDGSTTVVAGSGVLANDSDADDSPALTAAVLVGPVNIDSFTLRANGSFDYDHDGTENLTDSFTYTLSDGSVPTDTGSVSITIDAVNDAPVIASITGQEVSTPPDFYVVENTDDIGTIVATDVENDTLYYRFCSPSSACGVGANEDAGTQNDPFTDIAHSTYTYSITASGLMYFTPEDVLEVGTPDFEGDGSLSGNGNTYSVTVTVYDRDPDASPVASDILSATTGPLEIQVTDADDAPGAWLCETFTGGVSDDTVDDRFKYVNGDDTKAVILEFEEDDPATEAREDCHRIVGSGAETEYSDFFEGDKLVAYAITSAGATLPTDTDDVDYKSPLLYTVAAGLDQDIVDVDTDGTLYFAGITLITQYGASVAMSDIDGDRTDDVIERGGFVYDPPGNLDTDGIDNDYFLYRVCDNATASDKETECAVGLVEIQIEDVPPVAVASEDDVTFTETLSQSPLELPVPAIPNVFVLFDDTADGMQTDILTNDTVDAGQDGSEGKYIYSNDIKTWIMPYKLGNNNDYAPDEATDPSNGLWRLRNKDYNSLYYDPSVTYEPWSGYDSNSVEYADIDPTDAPDNPYDPQRNYDLTGTHSLVGGGGGKGGSRGQNTNKRDDSKKPDTRRNDSQKNRSERNGNTDTGSSGGGININYYWTWDDADTDTYVDIGEDDTKVDITLANEPFTGSVNRTDCTADAGAPLLCTYDEEIQNFANWYSYYRSRGLAAKGGLGAVISAAEDLRVGFAEFNGQSNVIGVDALNESPLTGHKASLLDKLYATGDSSGNNNMRSALVRTGNYFACESQAIVNEAQNKAPGEDGCPVLGAPTGNCQHNFALVISAGFWGGTAPGVESDSDASSSFDGGRYADTTQDTLADVALHFYERDLHPDLEDEVPTSTRDFDGVLEANWSTAFGGDDTLTSTTHQHMKTYVIGFGAQGDISFATAEAKTVDFDATSGDFWGDPENSDNDKLNDLVHTALNGRGAYLDAGNPTELNEQLTAAFEEFATFIGTATAVSSNAEEILVGSLIYRASYNVSDGTGQLIAQEISIDADGLIELGAQQWSAAEQLDGETFDTRTIFTWDPVNFDGVPFRYDDLNTAQREAMADTLVSTDPGFETEVTKHINYFRGDASSERPAGNLRERPEEDGRLGDIVNSTPTFYGPPNRSRRTGVEFPQATGFTYPEFIGDHEDRQDMVYLAANDGMFHAFNATTGDEEWAFIPNSVVQGDYSNRIKGLLDFEYLHEYINDLTPTIEDVFIDTTGSNASGTRNWATIVIGGLGAGGKGYYALDITEPMPGTGLAETDTSIIADMVLWEFTDEDDTYPTCERPTADACTQDQGLVNASDAQFVDTTLAPTEAYRDLGFSLSQPTIAMSNLTHSDGNHEWVTIFGNGYNSSSGRAKLYILRLERGIDGDWCHPDQVYDGNSNEGDTWDHELEGSLTSCTDGADFIKIELAGPINSPYDANNDGDTLDVGDDPDRVLANGLGTPRAIDINRDGTLDYAYAGDRFGNLYRFDLTSDDPDDWTGEVMFQATYTETGIDTNGNTLTDDTYRQPITTRPFAVVHPTATSGADCDPDPAPGAFNACGGFIIIFATGSYLFEDDSTDLKISSIYGVWERFQSGAANLITKSDLVEQAYSFIDADQLNRTLSENPVDYTGATPDKGYFIDLDTPGFSDATTIPFAGEKAIRNIQGFAGVIFVNSIIPRESSSCTNEAGGAQNAFCPDTGGIDCAGHSPVFDINNDGVFDENDLNADGSVPASLTIEDGTPTDSTFIGRSRITQLSDQTFQSTMINPATTESTGRLSWKQLDSTE